MFTSVWFRSDVVCVVVWQYRGIWVWWSDARTRRLMGIDICLCACWLLFGSSFGASLVFLAALWCFLDICLLSISSVWLLFVGSFLALFRSSLAPLWCSFAPLFLSLTSLCVLSVGSFLALFPFSLAPYRRLSLLHSSHPTWLYAIYSDFYCLSI